MNQLLKKVFANGPLLIIIAAVLWALDGIIRRNLYTIAPINIVFVEHVIGSLILFPFAVRQKRLHPITFAQMRLIAFVALLSSVLGTLWFTTALQKVNFIPFSVVFLLQKLQPIFAISTAVIFLKEKISKQYGLWAFFALTAAFFVTFPGGKINVGGDTIQAALYALGAAVAWGSATTFSKIALQNLPDQVVTLIRFLFASMFAFIGVVMTNNVGGLMDINISQLAYFFFIALSTGMVALLIYYKGLQQTEVKISTLLELAFPLLAIFIDIFLYKTVLHPTQYFSAGILMYSMYRLALLNHPKKIN